ncbi:hypothetical protein BDQ12DRAFT_714220 [Crucibulum laeve]|uniref:Uncharacterized protein n=1 Tax=Crucibulum laeve TaxID=68775 RepID=A0A5C3LUE9_9AGAR|nr:hypothetical protein BDQ12DRAFT_714220 [Crucibulum laeve]
MCTIGRTQERTQSNASDATVNSTNTPDDSPSKPSIKTPFTKKNTQYLLCRFLWLLIDIILLGFRQKFENRLLVYSASESSSPPQHQDAGDCEKGKPVDQSTCTMSSIYSIDIGEWRTGQQEEWNRLGMTTSLMATVSAASLAFSGIDESLWVARGAFAGALGLSMCGYLVIHYFGVLSEGVDDKKILDAVVGELTGGSRTIVAIAMSIPVLLSIYSAVHQFHPWVLDLWWNSNFVWTSYTGTYRQANSMSPHDYL